MKKSFIEELNFVVNKAHNQGWDSSQLDEKKTFLLKRVKEYSRGFGFSEIDIFMAMENGRNYCLVNYYDNSNFPSLEECMVFDDSEDLKKYIGDLGFRCPACRGVSRNPYKCESGEYMHGDKICDWKSYGLFGCLGNGFTFTIRSSFLEHGRFETIFKPIMREHDDDKETKS